MGVPDYGAVNSSHNIIMGVPDYRAVNRTQNGCP